MQRGATLHMQRVAGRSLVVHPVSSGFIRFHPVLSGSVRFCPVLSGFVRFCPVRTVRPVSSGFVRFRPVRCWFAGRQVDKGAKMPMMDRVTLTKSKNCQNEQPHAPVRVTGLFFCARTAVCKASSPHTKTGLMQKFALFCRGSAVPPPRWATGNYDSRTKNSGQCRTLTTRALT